MYTQRRALVEAKALWLEMAVMGYGTKKEYFKKTGAERRYINDCPLCEFYVKGRSGKPTECWGCPFQEFGAVRGCMKRNSPYFRWSANARLNRAKGRSYYAWKVYNFLAKAYRGRYRGKGGNI